MLEALTQLATAIVGLFKSTPPAPSKRVEEVLPEKSASERAREELRKSAGKP